MHIYQLKTFKEFYHSVDGGNMTTEQLAQMYAEHVSKKFAAECVNEALGNKMEVSNSLHHAIEKKYNSIEWNVDENPTSQIALKKPESRREQVIEIIEDERNYQLKYEDIPGSHITSELNMGGILSAIRYNLQFAENRWYNETNPYLGTTDALRKIAALCLKAGEDYGMSKRLVLDYKHVPPYTKINT